MKYEKEFNKLCKNLNIEYDKIYNKNESAMSLLIKAWDAAIEFIENRSCDNCKYSDTVKDGYIINQLTFDEYCCGCLYRDVFQINWEPKDETKETDKNG